MLMNLFEDHTDLPVLYFSLFALLIGYPITGNYISISEYFHSNEASILCAICQFYSKFVCKALQKSFSRIIFHFFIIS